MPLSRILILTGSVAAFVLMLTSVTASQEFVYAPDSAWRTSNDDAKEAVAVAAWRAQRSDVARTGGAPASATPAASPQGAATGTDTSSKTAGATSSRPAQTVSSVNAQPPASSAGTIIDDPWWKDLNPFGDDGDGDDDDDDDDSDDGRKKKGRKGRD